MLRRTLITALLATLALGGPAVAQIPKSSFAPEQRGGDQQRDVPLGQIQRELKQRYGGQMLDARKQGDSYIISWIDGDGRRLTIEVDAKSGRIISAR